MASPQSRIVYGAAAILRAAGILATVLFFFVVGAPIQWLVLRFKLPFTHILPRLFFRSMLALVGLKVVLHGTRPEQMPEFIVANHISWTDIPVFGTIYPVSFLAKREVSTWPIVATFASLEGTVFVDRSDRKSILEANAAMAERLRSGACIALFPEGTTYDGTTLGPFHSSHFAAIEGVMAAGQASLRLQPIAIRYSAPHAAWLGDAALLPHVVGLLQGPTVTCHLVFCEPLTFETISDRKAIAQECRKRIATALAEFGASPQTSA